MRFNQARDKNGGAWPFKNAMTAARERKRERERERERERV